DRPRRRARCTGRFARLQLTPPRQPAPPLGELIASTILAGWTTERLRARSPAPGCRRAATRQRAALDHALFFQRRIRSARLRVESSPRTPTWNADTGSEPGSDPGSDPASGFGYATPRDAGADRLTSSPTPSAFVRRPRAHARPRRPRGT